MFNLVFDNKKNEVIVCFMGLDNHHNLLIENRNEKMRVGFESYIGAGIDFLGGIPASARQAMAIGKMLKEVTENKGLQPVMIGHSHGGGLAQCAAVANGIKGVVFNSRPMGAGIRRYIGQEKVAENAKNITAFSGKGDWLSGNRAVNFLASFFERLLGIPVPRTIGQGYHLPHLANKGWAGNHDGFYEGFEILKGPETVK